MTDFATSGLLKRRQILEEALVKILERDFDFASNGEGECCIIVAGYADDEDRLLPIWTIASELEVLLA